MIAMRPLHLSRFFGIRHVSIAVGMCNKERGRCVCLLGLVSLLSN